MNNNKLQKGIEYIKDIKLSDTEKHDVFAHLDAHMKKNPIAPKRLVSPWSLFFIQFKDYRLTHVLTVVLIYVCIAASITYAAERALPGDVLYPIKIYINEPIKSIAKTTSKAKTEFEKEKVIKRITEVETLIKRGEFDTKKRIQVEKELDKSIKTINLNNQKDKVTDNKNYTDFEVKIDARLDTIRNIDTEVDVDKKGKDDHDTQDKEIEKFENKIKDQFKNLNRDNIEIKNII
jgi:hypothetical protein